MPTRKPRPPRWRAPFLRALRKYGNVQFGCDTVLVNQSYPRAKLLPKSQGRTDVGGAQCAQ